MTRNLVPQLIIEQFIQGRFHGRLQAVTLFIDISGFTAITNVFMQQGKEGGEAMARVMQAIFNPLVEAVYGQGGFITGFAGDAFTAVFPIANLPTARAPATARALSAAVAMQQQLLSFPTQTTPPENFHFSIKIGLAIGAVEWGIVGEREFESTGRLGELSHGYYFRGTAIEGSAKAESQAQANEILLTPSLYREVKALVAAKPKGSFWRLTENIHPLPASSPIFTPPSDLDLLANFVPRTILQQDVQGEYRHVLTLFLNLHQIHTHQQLVPFVQTIFELQKNFGGYLNTVDFGDKGCTLLLFWGMPTSYENDLARMFNFVETLKRRTNTTFRAGITYWLMYAGFVGSSRVRQEYSCYGRGVNLAARLMEAAPWGRVWTDMPTMERAQDSYQFIIRGHYQFKGFAEAQPAYEFAGQSENASLQFQGRMVGRQMELAQMAQFVRPLQNGRFAGTLLITGEAGIGKSRLVDAFKKSTVWKELHINPRWFYSATDEILRQALNPFRYLLQRYFRQSKFESQSKNEYQFTQKMDSLLAATEDEEIRQQLQHSRPFLGALLNLSWPDSPLAQVRGKARFDNTLLALQALLKAESRLAPVILQIEDVHWLDDGSWNCLRHLAQTLRGYPVAMILTSRHLPEGAPISLPGPRMSINLTTLSEAGLAELAMQVLGRPPSPNLLRVLSSRCDGNPFFARQILLYLKEQDLLTQSDAPDPTATLLPLNVRAILVARLDQLTPSVREMVQRAAILGREFDVQLLSHMLQSDSDLKEKIKAAEQADIWIPLNQMRYLFRHALLRDAAYDMQLQTRRQELHQRAAEALETLYAPQLEPFYGELAYHYGQANLAERERNYIVLGARQAMNQYAYEEALRYLHRALELLPSADEESCFWLLLDREEVYHVQGKRVEQAADLESLVRISRTLDRLDLGAIAAARQSRHADVTSDYPAAEAAAEKAIALARAANQPDTEADGRYHLGKALWRQGRYKAAFAQLNRALAYYRQQNDTPGIALVRHQLGVLTYEQGNYAASRANYEELLSIRRALGDRMGEGSTLANLGTVANFEADFPRAHAYSLQALTVWRGLGYRQGEGSLLLNLGVIMRNLGDFAAAQAYLEQSLPISQEVGERTMESVILINTTLLYHQMNEQETAVRYGRRALDAVAAVNSPIFRSYALTWLAHSLTALHTLDEAEAFYHEAIAIRRSLGQKHLVIEPAAGLARIALARKDPAEIADYGCQLQELIAADPTLTGTEEPIRIYLTCYRCLRGSDPGAAAPILEQGHRLLLQRTAVYIDPRQRSTFLDIPAHQEMLAAWNRYSRD